MGFVAAGAGRVAHRASKIHSINLSMVACFHKKRLMITLLSLNRLNDKVEAFFYGTIGKYAHDGTLEYEAKNAGPKGERVGSA